jgi:hypothetical protein
MNFLVRLERLPSPSVFPSSPMSSTLPATNHPAHVHLLSQPSIHLYFRRSPTLPFGGNYGTRRRLLSTIAGMRFVWSLGPSSQATGFKGPSYGTENTKSTRLTVQFPLLSTGLRLTIGDLVSVHHMPYGPWPLNWLHLALWSRVIHVFL